MTCSNRNAGTTLVPLPLQPTTHNVSEL